MSKSHLKRLCLDTNIYIVGVQESDSYEAKILDAIGFYAPENTTVDAEIILSFELIDQIRRVGKYLWNKDKAGLILGLIWSRLNTFYVTPNQEWLNLWEELTITGNIPSEDIEIYLTAKFGQADCFVSGNRELIKAIADFECLTAADFVNKYINF